MYILPGLQGDSGSQGLPFVCNSSQVQTHERQLDSIHTVHSFSVSSLHSTPSFTNYPPASCVILFYFSIFFITILYYPVVLWIVFLDRIREVEYKFFELSYSNKMYLHAGSKNRNKTHNMYVCMYVCIQYMHWCVSACCCMDPSIYHSLSGSRMQRQHVTTYNFSF